MLEGASGGVCDELFDCTQHLRERERAVESVCDGAVDTAPGCARENDTERIGEGAYLVDTWRNRDDLIAE